MEEGAITGMTGVCVDLDSSMNEGCGNEIAANIKDGLIGCFDGEFVAKFLCGLSLTVKHGDLSTVQTEGNLFWPRVLLNGSEDANGDGQGGMHLECTDPIDCLQKCRYLERTARHGFGAPPACALCDQYCSSNLATTIMDVRAALFDDVLTVGRLIASCFGNHGLAGCICQFSLTLQPSWRKAANPNTRSGREIRCENGNPWDLLLETVDTWIIDWIEGGVNTLINVVNDFIDNLPWPLDFLGRPISRFCMPNPHQPDKCARATGTGGGTAHTLPSAKTLACRAALI